MKIRLLATAILLAACAAVPADSISIAGPTDGACVSPLKPAQKIFLKTDLATLRELFNDPGIVRYWSHDVNSNPAGITLDWNFSGARDQITYSVEWGADPELKDAKKSTAPHSAYTLYNLELGETYYWRANAEYKDGTVLSTPVVKFTVEPLTPRVLYVPHMGNVRDLGGRIGLEGRVVPQNKIFRSTGLNNNSSDGKVPGAPRFNDEGRRIMMEDFKIKTELDLRSLGETAGMTVSPLGESVKYINYSSTCYAATLSQAGLENYAQLFPVFCDPENYPIDFHCIAGADRTGTLAYILLAILGVDEEEILRDYCFTSFMYTRGPSGADSIAAGLETYGPGEPVIRQAERFLLDAWITAEQIMAFRDIMLGPGTDPGPVLAQEIRLRENIDQLKAAHPLPAERIQAEECPLYEISRTVAGHDLHLRTPAWDKNPLIFAGANADGETLFFFQNTNRYSVYARLKAPETETCCIFDPIEQKVFTSPSGDDVWTAEEISGLRVPLPEHFRTVLIVGRELPEGEWESVFFAEPDTDTAKNLGFLVRKLDKAPVLDGADTDGEWESVDAFLLTDFQGREVANPPAVKFASDAENNTLYLLIEARDKDVVAKRTGNDKTWEDDSFEFFLSEEGTPGYIQIVVSRAGGIYHGFTGAPGFEKNWDMDRIAFKLRDDGEKWSLEVALPLDLFTLEGFPVINVCSNNYPKPIQLNLVPTGGSFHNRAAMLPLIFE